MKCHRLWARRSCAFAILIVSSVPLHAQNTAATGPAESTAQSPHITPSPLLAIDQHRATVVERIDAAWGEALAYSGAGVSRSQLREMLMGLRADQLLAASLAGSLTGLRDVLAQSVTASTAAKPTLFQTKALGDAADDLVYTPVSPCRLFDTRTSQGGLGGCPPSTFGLLAFGS